MSQALSVCQDLSSFGGSDLSWRQAAQLSGHDLFSALTKIKCEGARGDGQWHSCRRNSSLANKRYRARVVDLSSEPEPPQRPTCQKRQTGMVAVPSTGTRRCDMGRTWLWLVGLHTRKRRIDQSLRSRVSQKWSRSLVVHHSLQGVIQCADKHRAEKAKCRPPGFPGHLHFGCDWALG